MSIEQLQAQLEALKAENEALRKTKTGTGLKVSEKGAISLYGIGRWPVTLYREQWERVLAKGEDIKAFIKANESKLAVKEPA